MKFNDVHLDPNCYIAPNCTLIGSVVIGAESSIFPGVTIRGDREVVTIGKNTNVQENAIMHVETNFPCTLGDNVTIGHGAIIHACTIEDNCIIGMGATVMDGAVVGENSVVGAGAVISKGVIIPPKSIVMGLPGKVKRSVNEAEIAYNQQSADDYSQNARELVEAGFLCVDQIPPITTPPLLSQNNRAKFLKQAQHQLRSYLFAPFVCMLRALESKEAKNFLVIPSEQRRSS